MKKILFLLVVLNCLPLFSQDKKVSIVWNSPQTFAADSYKLTLPSFSPSKNFSFDLDKGIQFVEQWKTNGLVNESSLIISNPVFVSISKSDLKSLNVNTIPASINATLKNAIARDVKYAVLTLSPIIKVGSTYKKLVSFNYSYNTNGVSNRISNIQTITNSVLSTGSWYKFEVERSGVFKISKSFLNQMGVNTDAVDPRTIKIFGNGGKMMPFANNANFPFDPTENAIKVIGEDDGVFNNEDYILFYAQGPTADVEVSYINTNINPYSNKTVYYINISSGLGKRIQNFIQPTTAATLVVDTFQDYKFHEVDETNIIFVGRRWFGENFSVESTQSFNFDFPNLVTSEPINIKVVTATTSSNATSFGISVNTNSIGNIALSQTNSADGVYVTGGTFQDNTLVSGDDINVTLDYNNQGNPSATAYLDYIGIEATRSLTFNGNQFHFKNQSTTVNTTGVANYNLSNAAQVQEVWDVTNIYDVATIPNTNQDNVLSFNAPMGDLKTFVTVSSQNYYQPILSQNSRVNNINLKGTIFQNAQGVFQDIDYLMLTTRSHLGQAQRLAQINRDKKNLNVKVVILDEIYTEFSSGNPDIAGIRNFVKYVYDNASTPENRVKYLCIFGDSSFDYKGRIASNTYNFPTWNAYSSFNLSSSFISDDFYAYVDDNEGTLDVFNNANKLDIAVGRVLADTPLRASQMVDKVETYYSKEALGSWRNNFVVVSDDVDEAWEATLQETTDEIGDEVTAFKPFINVTKIHSDSYQQEASAGGDRYPEVKEAMTNAIERGAIMVNYFGHGGEDGLAFERIFQNTDAEALNNDCKLNLFVTVTCEFTRFDNPLRITAGEFIYWNKDAGSIGLITTTRQIFVTVGKDFNKILKEYLFSYSTNDTYSDYEYPSIAEALRLAKNDPDFSNAQKSLAFYIGDPALQLAFPQPDIRLTKVNDVSVTQETDVLQALSYAKLEGVVTDVNGNTLTDYNGVLTTTIYDKQIERETLANDNTTDANGIIKLNYTTLGAIVFRGQATVTNGQWEIDFIVPKDIGIPVGTGKVSFYATQENSLEDKTGASVETLKIGGINPNAAEDNIGPTIQLYMNDEAFVSGGITNESPLLLAKFEDDNGINTASGIGHDIVAILDGDEVNPYVLNDYYLTDVDDYTKGSLDFPFRDLEPGLHTLNLKAWDVYNNSATAEIQFVVYNENESLVINNVLNYPNPFVNYTEFWFSHNSSEVLDISVQIFTVSGKLVRTLNGQTALAGGKNIKSTSRDIVWDGRDDFGDKIGKGTYIYKLKVHSQSTNKTVEKIEKLVIL